MLLILNCELGGARDVAAVQDLLRQYGLHSARNGRELTAEGRVPRVLDAMKPTDIEEHLLRRIEDAVPGTRVASITAALVPRNSKSKEC